MASSGYVVVFLLLFVFLEAEGGAQQHKISLGSSLSPTVEPTSWKSPSGQFAFGLYPQDTGFIVGIWLVGKSEDTVVWTANRDDLPLSVTATVEFSTTGKLLVRPVRNHSEVKLIADSSASASSASMLDSGNFVLYDNASNVIWESFDFPTDTILGGQNLFSGHHLFSRSSKTNYSTGQFHLDMQIDGNAVLYPVNTPETARYAYWSTDTYGTPSCHLYLNSTTGSLCLINTTDSTTIKMLSGNHFYVNTTTIYRAILEYDGVFRLYSHSFDGNGDYKSLVEWSRPADSCHAKGFCGLNSYCTFNDNQPVCVCLPGSDPNQNSDGCERDTIVEQCKDGKDNASFYNITVMENMRWEDSPYSKEKMSKEDCSRSCLEDCNCEVALFDQDGYCSKQKLPLKFVARKVIQEESSTAFFKVSKISFRSNNNDSIPFLVKPHLLVITSKKALTLILVVILGFITCSCVFLVMSGFFIFKYREVECRRLLENGNLGFTDEITLRSFSYSELRKATNGFKDTLGKGAFGSVYKGALNKGRKLVAVKRLEKVVNEGEREFLAETRAIGSTHHRNLVRLLGYCAEDSKRLLVYEYMSNGSLADLLFRAAERRPDWNERLRIALDVARGILYLHEECDTPTIHCDIKPQNILMDDFWTAKISDFGLAKLLMPDQTRTFTIVRGTRGYLAPEWQKNIPISVKADIYSYGIVLLEIVSCRRNMEYNELKPEEIVLSTWVYKCFVCRELEKLVIGEEVDKTTLEKMVKVGLWCIQDEPALRPSMKSVVLMLEGIIDVAIPPCPTSTSM